MNDAAELLNAISKLLGILVWPALALFALVRYGSSLKEFVAHIGEFTLKGAGFEASAKRMQAEATAALVAATVARPQEGTNPETTARDAQAAANAVVESITPRSIRRAGRATVLWVDDRPENNNYERQALEALGINFVISTSTDDAITKLQKQKFDVVISDMGRPPDQRAGYTLLDQMRKSKDETPFVIYASSRAPEHVAEARAHGAIGCTNRPNELFEYVVTALGR
jgi:CheY-like chemotaxis protein